MESKKEKCPICESPVFEYIGGSFDICPVCGWEDDGYQLRNKDETGANGKWTLNAAKKAWAEGKTLFDTHPHP